MILRIAIPSAAAVLLGAVSTASAQNAVARNLTLGDINVAGSVRTRSYSWNWFGDAASGSYTYPASLLRVSLWQTQDRYDWTAEWATPVLMALPSTAIAPPPAGQLGLGAAYAAANAGTTTASLFLKQAYVRVKRLGKVDGQSVTFGRLEFNDGAEVAPKNKTLAELKRDRISQRLLGTFGFSDVGRSIDGVLYTFSGSNVNVTGLAGRPTQGVFDVNGWPELDINVFYAAVTGDVRGGTMAAEWRVFAVGYDDRRHGILKTDNRSPALRTSDANTVAIGTYGGHYLQQIDTTVGSIDLLAWGAIQTGAWGSLAQRAGAFAAEAGWQPVSKELWKPGLRGGLDYGSGDGDPTDGTHGTFFQILPTPRVYARLPFFNMMNTKDAFGELLLRPSARVALRGDVHTLRLADAHDLWYAGGGAFQSQTFGYTGRPSNGQTGLATLYDASADYGLNAHVALTAYYGHAHSSTVTQAIYHAGSGAHFGYIELLVRF